jgi:hypothetical protein
LDYLTRVAFDGADVEIARADCQARRTPHAARCKMHIPEGPDANAPRRCPWRISSVNIGAFKSGHAGDGITAHIRTPKNF